LNNVTKFLRTTIETNSTIDISALDKFCLAQGAKTHTLKMTGFKKFSVIFMLNISMVISRNRQIFKAVSFETVT